jgi:hypothetical protein
MKTYLLKNTPAVEPKAAPKTARPPRLPKPSAPAPGPALFIGLDVHNESIAVSLAPSDSTEVRRYGIIGGTHDDVLRLSKRLAAAHPGMRFKFCYEAGPHGYPLCRFLQSHGHSASWSRPPRCRASRGTASRPIAAMPINSPAFIGPGN